MSDLWQCQDCGANLSNEKYGPAPRWCWACRNPGQVLPPTPPKVCDGCQQVVTYFHGTVEGRLCRVCIEPFLERQRAKVLALAARDAAKVRAQGKRISEATLARYAAKEKELVK